MTDTLHAGFVEHAVKHPDAPAVFSDAGTLTYRDLDRQSQELAERLTAEGAGPGIPIGICIERTPDLLVGILGILRTGSCYLPLDPAYPTERLRFMVQDSGTCLLLTTPTSRASCPAGARTVVLGGITTADPGVEPVPAVPADTAYVIYTSGSTGQPKGVAIRHSSCVAMLSEMDRFLDGCDLSVASAVSSICFDMSVMEIFHTLCRGGAVVLVETALHLPESQHVDRVTHLNAIPSVMSALLDADGVPPNLRSVVLGGEPLRRKLVDRVYRETTATRVFNAYGPTEATVFCTFGLVPEDETGEPSIGTPSVSARVYLLDERLRQLPVGAAGEIYIGGAGLASGYVNRPRATVERFVPDPFLDGERMYRTGDVAQLSSAGMLEFVGRSDRQVKVRGYRVELEEVESRLTAYAEVSEAAVVVRGNALVAYIVPVGEIRQGVWLDADLKTDIAGRLSSELPPYMVPETVVFVSALPLAPGGKVDRAALPPPPVAGATGLVEAASTTTEIALSEIWGMLLDLDPASVGVRATFFDLGGDSLLLVRMARALSRRFGRRVGVSNLFRFRDIASLARWLDDDNEDATPEVVQAARRRAAARRSMLSGRTTRTGR